MHPAGGRRVSGWGGSWLSSAVNAKKKVALWLSSFPADGPKLRGSNLVRVSSEEILDIGSLPPELEARPWSVYSAGKDYMRRLDDGDDGVNWSIRTGTNSGINNNKRNH